MKFGRKIKADLYAEWRPFYLDYNLLKRELKDRTTEHGWTEDDEREFTAMLERELDKIHDFQKEKTSELSRRIRDAEKDVKRLVAEDYSSDSPDQTAQQSVPPAAGPQSTVAARHLEQPSDAGQSGATVDTEAQQQSEPGLHQDAGSDDEDTTDDENADDIVSVDALEDQFHILEEEVATLVADVHDLALYTKLNITGFMKILKKHDKQTKMPLKSTFIQEYLEKRPFYKYNWDRLIVKLSKLYDLVRTRGHPVVGDSSAGGSQSAFVRQTTKYWVHPDNLVHLKLAILRHLPVLVFNTEKEFEPKDAAITSIYFDNEELELYLGRLEKTEGAEAIRLRWYGDVDTQTIFVERKTHREDWTGEKSVKARFPIKENKVNAFLRGEYTVDADFQELVTKGKKTQQEVDSMIQLANEVQYAILTRKLQPVMRTFYNRTAFQLPGDARVRISLDTELTMIREDNWDGRTRSGNNWRRTDIGIDHPFDQVAPEDKELFKYGVLEVKLQTQYGQEPPQWVLELVNSHLVEAVPKFSKFIHGCATLLPHRVDLVPFWLPQMDTDILKPDTGALSISRPAVTSSQGSSEPTLGTNTPNREAKLPAYTEPVSEGEEDEEIDIAPADDHDTHKRTGLTSAEVAAAASFREHHLMQERAEERERRAKQEGAKAKDYAPEEAVEEEDADDEADDERTPFLKSVRRKSQGAAAIQIGQNGAAEDLRPRGFSIDPLAPSSAFDQTLRDRLQKEQKSGARDDEDEDEDEAESASRPAVTGDDRVLERGFTAPTGKKIAVPVRIEPKVYFASERTFLKWLNFAVLIGTIATTLLNFIPPDDQAGLISAGLFTLAALLAIAYSAVVFVYRSIKLRRREADGLYYDKYGPTILCFVLLAALATNVGLRVAQM
ncbi:SPX-domain-containing protein [Punctularia strigosozonata HHB-11173 SS5]|uniref:SPX-domain-containing protein n=1 Tax=Punctularia strigosozonata (strain HHB-11173) TaxID=741275 RepID=UPI0004416DFF|nr:SPX-domain-containing protein [Punctularia strigosozonata HHB-11173 SS5]EIN09987.1 SPX-domain-containing protein [Punctularia strigosozonata HHB-11173 SS5]